MLARFGWLIGGGIFSGLCATAGAWIFFSFAMSGFNTSQQTLSASLIALQTSLDEEKRFRENKSDEAKVNLALEIKNLATAIAKLDEKLGVRLEENSQQVASLNATLLQMDKRLNESVNRQQAFETLVLQRIVFSGPTPKEQMFTATKAWEGVGYIGTFLTQPVPEGKVLSDWETLTKVNNR